MAISAGSSFGHYEVLSLLGVGGMGEVYRAKDKHLDREVAIKVLPADYASNADRLKRFEQEARATSALNHPNILTVHDLGLHEGAPYIVAELLEGEELRAALKRGAIELPHALDYAQQIAAGLAAAHAKNIVHRDLKPENLFVTTDGFVKILDFGLAKLRPPEAIPDSEAPTQRKITDPGSVMGTASYMSPEQARGQEVDARSDIFSLGVVLYEMIANQPPFTGVNALDVIGAILNQEPEPLRQLAPDVPAELQRIVSKALRKDREQRYQHVKDLLIDLKDLKQELVFEAKLKGAQSFGVPPSGGILRPSTQPPEGGTTNAQATEAATKEATVRTTSSAEIILGEIKRHKLGLAVTLAILIAALAGGGYGLYKLLGRQKPPDRVSGPAPRIVPFTSFLGNECCPSFSPDGNQIAYAWGGEKGENSDIYIKLIDAGSPLRLTSNVGYDEAPAWSPDGRYLAFIRYLKGESGIFLVPALGGAERLLRPSKYNGEVFSWLSWSPDGKYLAFAKNTPTKVPLNLFLLSVDSLEERQLTFPTGGFGDYSPAISPDGKTLAFIRMLNSGPTSEIYLIPITGGSPKRLTFDDCPISQGIAWTPDGSEIIYSSVQEGKMHLLRIPVTGGTSNRIAAFENNVSHVAVSRQGNRLAYLQYKDDTNIWRFDASGKNRKAVPTKLIASTLQEHSPQYSADGQRVVFTSNRSGNVEIWVCQSDGTNPVQITSLSNLTTGTPRWSPDGRRIAFDTVTDGQRDIYVIGTSGGKPRRITSESANDVRPSWSRDGKWIYFGSNRTGDWQVWKAPAEGGDAIQVTKQGGREAFESPDGKFVYYTKITGISPLWRVPTMGGEESRVLDQIPQGYWGVLEQGIYYLNVTAAKPALEFFSFATTHITQLAVIEKALPGGTPGFTVSPDGRWILLVQYDQSEGDIMLMENFR